MRFDCAGFVTGWSAHTTILTASNFLDLLTHTIKFQVWRPDPSGNSYQLVGSNLIQFTGGAGLQLERNNITTIPGQDDIAFFSFNQILEQSEWIFFLPGDVVGWFIPYRAVISPLSPLFRNSTPVGGEAAIDLLHKETNDQECSVCNIAESAEVVSSAVPLVAVTTGESTIIIWMG